MNERPDKYPDWALENITEEIVDDNGKVVEQRNVYEPPQVKKQYGVLNRTTMGRQWFNWLFRYVANWIRYLDAPPVYTIATAPDPTAFPVGKIIYISDEPAGGFNGIPAYTDGIRWRQVNNGREIG